jgi:hypothetical protein
MITETCSSPAVSEDRHQYEYGNARTLGTTPDRVLAVIGARLVDAAKALRQKITPLRRGSGIATPLILTLEDAGFFLQGHPTENLLYETGRTIRRRPLPFMLIGAALGFMLARGTRR